MALTIGTGLTIGGGITFEAIPFPWTWDPAYVGGPGLALSNGNLVVTANYTMNGEPSVLGTWPIPPGKKVMFSLCALAVTATDVSGIGVGNQAMDLNDFIGANFATSQGVYENGGNYTQDRTPSNTGLTYTSLDTIDVAIDRVNNLFWYRVTRLFGTGNWNDSNTANPATATGGYPISDLVSTVYPAAGPYYVGTQNPPTGTFAANAYTFGDVPAGFAFAPATAPVWTWRSLPVPNLAFTFSGRTLYDNVPGAYSALGSYAIGDTARVMYTVTLDYDADPALVQNQAVGFGLNSTDLNDGLGTDNKSMAVYNSGTVLFENRTIYSGLPVFVAGDVIDVALTGTYVTPGWWYRVNGGDWNGDPTADPATNTGGLQQAVDDTSSPLYPAASIIGNAGPSVFTIQDVPLYAVPAGFTFLGTSQVPAAPATWTWDPAYLGSPDVSLSNGNLVVTANSVPTVPSPSVLGTLPIPVGSKIMFSMCALSDNDHGAVGVGSHAMNLDLSVGDNFATSQGVFDNGVNRTQTQLPDPTGLTFNSLTTIDVAIDRVNDLFWYRIGAPGAMSAWNDGYNGADPATATGGYPISDLSEIEGSIIYPAASMLHSTPWPGSFGANYQAGGTTPAGFTFVPATAPVLFWNKINAQLARTFSNRTLYDNNATGTHSALGNYPIADTARVMFSVLLSNQTPDFLFQALGFGTSSTDLQTGLGSNNQSMGVFNDGNVYFANNIQHSGLPTFGSGDVIDIAMQGSYYSPGWWYRVNGGDWNGDPTADPSTDTGSLLQMVNGGPLYPAASLNGGVFTVQDVPLYTVPEGFRFLGTSQGTPPPVSVGLQVNLDAATYSGTGPWIDSVNSAQYALYNGVTYSSTIGGGSFGFDPDLSQYAYCTSTPATMTNWTVEAWHYYDGTYDPGNPCIVSQEYTSSINFALGSVSATPPGVQAGFYNGGWQATDPQTLTSGNWYQIVGTCENLGGYGLVKIYINGVIQGTQYWSGVPPSSSSAGTYLMHRWDNADCWGGRLGIVRIYDTDIGAAGVRQNYLADRARFGL